MKKPINFIKLNGGLGNQLFQFSLGQYLNKKKDRTIKYDKSYFEKKVDAPVIRIDKVFDIKLKNIKKDQLKFKTRLLTNRFIIYFLNCISPKLLEKVGIFIEKNKKYDERILENKKFFYFSGYFQSENYFLGIKKELVKKIKLKKKINKPNLLLLKKIQKTCSVALHVRRTDYINNPNYKKIYNVCNKNYYLRAIKILEQKFKQPFFFIFSDDIQWVKQKFSYKKNVLIVELNYKEKDHVYDFELMRNCKHFIISNSSFSWWSCWLGSNKNSVVISPKKWFSDKNQKRNPILDTWIKL